MSDLYKFQNCLTTLHEVKAYIADYNQKIKQQTFEIQTEEDYNDEYDRGRDIYNKYGRKIDKLLSIVSSEKEFLEFFSLCKETIEEIIIKKNDIMNKLSELKQKNNSEEEWKQWKHKWEIKTKNEMKKCNEIIQMRNSINQLKQSIYLNQTNQLNENEYKEHLKKQKKQLQQMTKELIQSSKNQNNINDSKEKEEIQEIRKRTYEEIQNKDFNLTNQQRKQIENWTSLHCSEVVFDSNKDDWNSIEPFKSKIFNRSQLIFLIEDEKGQKFGGYIHAKINKTTKQPNGWYNGDAIEDSNAFVFTLNSNRKGKEEMMKFEIIDKEKAFLLNDSDEFEWLFLIGRRGNRTDIVIYKEKNKSECLVQNSNFKYGHIENALRENDNDNNCFTPKRFIVIQMRG